jgi:hypothetical protein
MDRFTTGFPPFSWRYIVRATGGSIWHQGKQIYDLDQALTDFLGCADTGFGHSYILRHDGKSRDTVLSIYPSTGRS